HPCIQTKDSQGKPNGYLIPIYNVHDGFLPETRTPQQVYMTVIAEGTAKCPHLHFIRTGFFTCIKGNVKIVANTQTGFEEYLSGENHQYRSIEVPAGTPALIINLGEGPAYVLNMPHPAWTPDMN